MRLASREGGDDRSAFGASGLGRSFVDGPNWRPRHSAQLREVFGAPLTPCALASHGAMNGAHECERLRRFPLLRVRRCRAASSPAWRTSSAPEQSHAAPSLITSPYRRQSVTSGPGGPAIREPPKCLSGSTLPKVAWRPASTTASAGAGCPALRTPWRRPAAH
jgi:hypothetical protein